MTNARAPIYNVELDGNDLSEFISTFTYEDTMKKDNLLRIRIHPEKALEFLNNESVTVNADLVFQFGYLSKELSTKHTAKIQDIVTRYDSSGVNITIVCLDSGHLLKKNSLTKIYKSKTSSQIAEEIADFYGFNKDIDSTSKVWENMPQGNRSDFDFLDMLSDKENEYVFFVRNDTLYFKKRGLDDESVLTFTYGKDGDVISFIPKQKLSSNSGTSSETLVTSVIDKDGSRIENRVNLEESKDKTILNSEIMKFDSKDNVLSKVASTAIRNKTIVKNVDDTEESENIANNLVKNENLKANEADLTVIGNPLLKPKEIITISGVSRRHEGNYQIVNVTHRIDSGGYISTCLIHTNGTNSGGNIGERQSSDTNKTIGPNKKENTVTLKTFDSSTNTLL